MKKRILSLLLVLAMCLALLPTVALADDVIVLTQEDFDNAKNGLESPVEKNGGTYELPAGSYQLGEDIELPEDKIQILFATLDLNGHTLQAEYVRNDGTLYGGTVEGEVRNQYQLIDPNAGVIKGGTFEGDVQNNGTISGGIFHDDVANYGGRTISGGTFYGEVYNSGTISGGVFYDYVNNESGGPITGGVFYGDVNNENGEPITGGVFLGGIDGNKPDSATEITIDFGDGETKTGYVVGNKLSRPEDPTREGDTFLGWYYNGKEWDFENDTIPEGTQEFTLKAKWESEADGEGFVIAGGLLSGLLEGAANVLDETFVDVSRGAYYYNAVEWAANHGIAGGVDSRHFAPDESATRAQAVTMLYRAAGCPDIYGENPFVDVNADDYYYEAVLWAVAMGITSGTDATHFSPDEPCTRGQIVTFLHRAARCYQAHENFGFTDVKIGSYCEDAINWAVENAITNGTGVDTFSPDSVCTRAQIVTFLYRSR